jgi:hypothetical protein
VPMNIIANGGIDTKDIFRKQGSRMEPVAQRRILLPLLLISLKWKARRCTFGGCSPSLRSVGRSP